MYQSDTKSAAPENRTRTALHCKSCVCPCMPKYNFELAQIALYGNTHFCFVKIV
jgi:hypothetical protein